jgi:hypothetical protein
VGSTGRCNTLGEHFSWCLIHQGLSGALVELASDGAEFGLTVERQIRSLGEILAQQAIGVFVGTALPRALRIAKIDVDLGRQGEALVISKFLAAMRAGQA